MRIDISRNNLLDILNLKFNVYNPVNRFMSKDDILSIIESFTLSNNNFFPLPIYFDISGKNFKNAKKTDSLNIFFNSTKVCDLNINTIYELKFKKKIGIKLFKTKDEKHPGFDSFLNSGKFFVQGDIENFNNKILNKLFFSIPEKVFTKIKKSGYKTIAGFHTRNVPHRGHEWIHNYALSKCEALMIHPLIGQFKKGEYFEDVIVKTNRILVKNIYKRKKIFLEFFNSYPRYAGPREALLHALVRKNYGCTHFLVGRDHAGAADSFGENYYKKYESQNLCKKYQSKLGIKIIDFNEPYICNICKGVVNNCKHKTKSRIYISGTKIRKLLLDKKKISSYLIRKKVSKTLSNKSVI